MKPSHNHLQFSELRCCSLYQVCLPPPAEPTRLSKLTPLAVSSMNLLPSLPEINDHVCIGSLTAQRMTSHAVPVAPYCADLLGCVSCPLCGVLWRQGCPYAFMGLQQLRQHSHWCLVSLTGKALSEALLTAFPPPMQPAQGNAMAARLLAPSTCGGHTPANPSVSVHPIVSTLPTDGHVPA